MGVGLKTSWKSDQTLLSNRGDRAHNKVKQLVSSMEKTAFLTAKITKKQY